MKAGTLRVVPGVAVLPVTALERGRYTFRFAPTKGAPQRLQAGSRAVVGAGKRRRVATLRRPANGLSVAVPAAGTRVRLEVRVRLPRVRTALRVELLRADRTRAGQVVTLRTPKASRTRKARRWRSRRGASMGLPRPRNGPQRDAVWRRRDILGTMQRHGAPHRPGAGVGTPDPRGSA